MTAIWIIAADTTRARILAAEHASSPLQEIGDLIHTEGRLHERDITQDLPGKIKNVGKVGGHAFEQQTDPKQHEAEVFAHRIAQYLEEAHHAARFNRLIIIAEPSMLGLLRKGIPEQVKKLVSFELDKNITSLDLASIRAHLPAYLP